ncbi:MAG: helix-turn-helix domain-containing protein [Deltaproteobacteria bacterium]|nr:helix-turn-helix domain-containing protein [Deltaproteobacteria bacterium]
MRGIDELDHYEMLEVPRGASPGEIDRAYRMAQETWAEGSLALYSIFEKRDASEIRARLDEAYRVLADPELRASYDQSHRATEPLAIGPTPTATIAPAAPDAAAAGRAINGAARTLPSIDESARVARAAEAAVTRVFEEDTERYDGRDDDAGGEYDGPRLRRTRLFRGYEIDQIADVTKVSGSHLRNIEDENFADLPADVYVRGFVTAYARTIGLDPVLVVPSYMTRLQESRQKNSRSRFLGLR